MDKIIQSLDIIGYAGEIKNPSVFKESLELGPKDIEYTKLVNYLTNELKSLCNIDEEVNVITAPEDSVSFLMELSSFLKELGCPYETLTQGHVSDRLNTQTERILLLDYLISELMAARMVQHTKPDKTIKLNLQESKQAMNLKKMLMTLRFPKPPENITIETLFDKLIPSVEKALSRGGKELIGIPIFTKTLDDKQWHKLGNVQNDLHQEYKIRREMILKRLDCTIQSFQWSDKMKNKDELISNAYSDKRKLLKVEPAVSLADLLAAREDLAFIEKTSSVAVRKNTKSSLNKVMIGQVPDRGGRTSEQAPPPPEMPSWQQRQAGPSGGGRGGGRGGYRGRGDFSNTRGAKQDFSNSRGGGKSDFSNSRGGGRNEYSQSHGGGRNEYSNSRGGGRNEYSQSHGGGTNDYSNPRGGYNQANYNNDRGQQYNNQNFDSAGSYSNNYNNYGRDDYQAEPKRPKTFDSFQNNRQTYADQYVQESQHNQQYQPRRGGGRDNNRGGGGNRNYY